MKDFKVTHKSEGSVLNMSISGDVTISSNFPNFTDPGIKEIFLNVGGITYINSAGIRKWLLWSWNIEKNYPNSALTIDRVPPVLVKQIAVVKDFVPKNAIIRSFVVPYYCEACDEMAEKEFLRGDAYGPDIDFTQTIATISQMTCPKCAAPMDIDAIPEQYKTLVR